MISKPKNGWCKFKLGKFKGTPSYLTDVPVGLLSVFIDYHTTGSGVVWFDEEGTEFSLVITPYSLFIIEEKENPVLHDFSEINIGELEKELIEDIESDLDNWQYFMTDDDPEEITQHRNEILQKIAILKKYMGK